MKVNLSSASTVLEPRILICLNVIAMGLGRSILVKIKRQMECQADAVFFEIRVRFL